MTAQERREIVLKGLLENREARWLLYEVKNLYRYFKEYDARELDDIKIPGTKQHDMGECLENLMQAVMDTLGFTEDNYPDDWFDFYETLDVEVELKMEGGFWYIRISNDYLGKVYHQVTMEDEG